MSKYMFDIPEYLHDELKREAAKDAQSVRSVLILAVKAYLGLGSSKERKEQRAADTKWPSGLPRAAIYATGMKPDVPAGWVRKPGEQVPFKSIGPWCPECDEYHDPGDHGPVSEELKAWAEEQVKRA